MLLVNDFDPDEMSSRLFRSRSFFVNDGGEVVTTLSVLVLLL